MYIPIDDTQNYPFCRLQLAADTHNSRKVPEVNNLTNKKTLIYNFGDLFTTAQFPLPPCYLPNPLLNP